MYVGIHFYSSNTTTAFKANLIIICTHNKLNENFYFVHNILLSDTA